MNVLLAPVSYFPMKSGVPIFTQNLADGLVRKGHQVVIVTPKLDKTHHSLDVIDGVEVHRMPFAFPWEMLWRESNTGLRPFFRYVLPDMQRLVRLIAKKDVEVVAVHSPGSQLPYALCATFFSARPLVIGLHGNEFFRLKTGHNRMRQFLLRCALSRAMQITAVSSHVAEQAARFYPEASGRIVTITNGIAINQFEKAAGPAFTFPYLLALARFNPLKGLDLLLVAFQRVAEHDSSVHLIIAGDGSQRIRLRAVTMALGLTGRVTFLGEVGREEVKQLLAGCRFLVLSSWSEGMPNAVLEAMASGKAVVATRVGGVPEVVLDHETGRLVPPGDPHALAEAMLSLLRDRDRCRAMGEKGRAFVKARHDVSRTIERYLEVYQNAILLSRRNGRGQRDVADPRVG